MKTQRVVVTVLATVGLSGAGIRAQEQDPRLAEGRQVVREILQKVQDEMQAIDRMLLEAARPAQQQGTTTSELLEESDAAHTRVARHIDELLEEIEKRQGQGC